MDQCPSRRSVSPSRSSVCCSAASSFSSSAHSPPPAFVNNERLPAYHRLDVGAKKTGPLVGPARYTLTMTVSNVYGRRNVWFYRFENTEQGRTRIDVPQIPVPVPYVTFSVDF